MNGAYGDREVGKGGPILLPGREARNARGTDRVHPYVRHRPGNGESLTVDNIAMAWRRVKSPRSVYSVYIIELSRDCMRQPCAFAPLYVGQTAHTPEHRFEQHKAGGMLAASKAHKFGTRLRYDLMKGIGPFRNRKEAEAAEQAVAAALKRRGHRVFCG